MLQLPIHGFVLAGGQSSRMGRDKALLPFRGRPMVEIAVGKLRTFCAEVSIAGNRDDLAKFAEIVPEYRVDQGPGAGVEAGLRACRHEWALFVPVDVPLVPSALLRRYAEVVIERGAAASNLGVTYAGLGEGKPASLPGGQGVGAAMNGHTVSQPAFCMLRRDLSEPFSVAMDRGERRLARLLHEAAEAGSGVHRQHDLYGYPDDKGPDAEEVRRFFLNVNTPEELALAERETSELDADPLRG